MRDDELIAILKGARRVAVVGISADPARQSHAVAAYLRREGFEIVPVNPRLDTWEGLRAFGSLAEVPGALDAAAVFRRPEHVPEVVDDAIAKGVPVVWL